MSKRGIFQVQSNKEVKVANSMPSFKNKYRLGKIKKSAGDKFLIYFHSREIGILFTVEEKQHTSAGKKTSKGNITRAKISIQRRGNK
jgi:hypothetical protein